MAPTAPMELQAQEPPLSVTGDSAGNPGDNNGLKDDHQPSASAEGIYGGGGRSGFGTSNGKHDASASVGDAKIGGQHQLPPVSTGVGGGPANKDAALRWART